MHKELKTIRDFIRYATSCFNAANLHFGHGTDNAWDEATTLVLHTLYLSHHSHPALLDANLTKAEQRKLYDLIDQRVTKKIPVPYLTHEAWFAGLSFYVDERVLIPRSPMAELILKGFTPWIDPDTVHMILDIGTGSGCIAIACAKVFSEAKIIASDISKEALTVAKINVLRHEVDEQIELEQADLFPQNDKKYDIIISNPPYVSAEEMAILPSEYKHEPALGLAAGKKGLEFVLRIMKEASRHLTPSGLLAVEVGNSETALIEKFPHVPFIWPEFEHSEGGVFLLTAKELNSIEIV